MALKTFCASGSPSIMRMDEDTAVAPAGTSLVTAHPAPILAFLPTFAPIITPSAICGAPSRLCPLMVLEPMVTFWKIMQFSAMVAAAEMKIPERPWGVLKGLILRLTGMEQLKPLCIFLIFASKNSFLMRLLVLLYLLKSFQCFAVLSGKRILSTNFGSLVIFAIIIS